MLAVPKILIVEGGTPALEEAARILRHQGYEVVQAENGESALRQARTVLPDILLLNGVLPDFSRQELLRQLQVDPALSGIAVATLRGADANGESPPHASDAHDDIGREELLACVRSCLGQREHPVHPPVDEEPFSAVAAHEAVIRLAAIVESSDDAMIGKDLHGNITSWNKGAEKIFGHSVDEMLGTSIIKLIPPDRLDEESRILVKVARGEKIKHFETRRLTKDGRLISVSITTSPIRNVTGKVIGVSEISRDITVLREGEREIGRLSRLCAALSHISQAIVWMPTRNELFRKVCQVLVNDAGFKLAWIGWHDPATQRVMPIAQCGDENDYLKSITVYSDDRPEGCYPSGTAFRLGRSYICKDFLTEPANLPWRTELLNRGFRACAVFPIRLKDNVAGTLSVSSDEPWFSHDREIALLEEAATDISFALDNFAREEERAEAEALARNERIFSDTMIESMPGILYFYDEQGRFLRWNRNFEVVSGYSSSEIAKMRPLDFFRSEDQALVEEKIADVFRLGESTVEASFKAKNGDSKPYFFTGRRVIFKGAPCLVGMGIDISERKEAEQALRQSEGKLRVIFEQAPLGIAVLDSNSGRFRKLNPQYCRITGYSEAEMLGLDFQRITHPDDLKNDLGHMQRLREDRISAFQIEKRYIRKDASIVWVTLTCVPLWEGTGGEMQHIAMIGDITERKQSELRLAESERKYRELVELANSIILRWNCDGKITFLNEYGQQFFGYSAEEILGRHVVGTLVPATDTSGCNLQLLMEQICAAPADFEKNVNENVRRNGERVWIAWTNRILRDENGGVVEILSVGTDITEQRRAGMALRVLNETLELEVAERTSELQAALIRAEAADRIKSAFLAAMSHELRTPLNSIIGFTGIMLRGLAGPLNPEQAKQLGMVQTSARHLLALINDVLDLSKIEAGQLEVRTEPFDLPSSIESVAASLKPLAEKKGLVLTAKISPALGEMVSDRRRVEQILLNLLSNAIKFTDQGRVTLTAEPIPNSNTSADTSCPAVRLRVTDTGIGLKPEHLSTLFQPFHQIDTGLARQHEGTGLGLAICRKLATLMGGDISAAGEWSRGSEFTLTLPLKNRSRA